VEATGARDWFTHTMVDGVRWRGWDAGKMGAPLPEGCSALPTNAGNVHQYLAVNSQFGGGVSNTAFALDDVAVVRVPSFEALQTVLNHPPLTYWGAHPLLMRYLRVAVGPDSAATLRDTVSGGDLTPVGAGAFAYGDPVTAFSALVVAGDAYAGVFVGSTVTFNATVASTGGSLEPFRVRVLSAPTGGVTLTDGETGAPLGVGALSTDLRVSASVALVGGSPFYATFAYELVGAYSGTASVNTATASIAVQTEFSPEYAGIRSDSCLAATGEGSTGVFSPEQAVAGEGGVVLSAWLRTNTTAGNAAHEAQLVVGSDGCLVVLADSLRARTFELCYRNATTAAPASRVLELRAYTLGVLTGRQEVLDLAAALHFTDVWQYVAVRVSDAGQGGGAVFSTRVNSALVANGTASSVAPPLGFNEIRVGSASNTLYCIEGAAVLTPPTQAEGVFAAEAVPAPQGPGHALLTRWNEDPGTAAFTAGYYLFGEPQGGPAPPPVPDQSGNGRDLVDVFPNELEDSVQTLTTITPLPQALSVLEDVLVPVVLTFSKLGSQVGIFPVIASLPTQGTLYDSPDGVTPGVPIVGPVNAATDAPLASLTVFYRGNLNYYGADAFSFALNYNITGVTTVDVATIALAVDSNNDPFSVNGAAVAAVQELEDFTPVVVRNIVPTAIVDVDVGAGPFTTYEIVNATVRCVQSPACPAGGAVNDTYCATFAPICRFTATGPATVGTCDHQCVTHAPVVTATVLPGAQVNSWRARTHARALGAVGEGGCFYVASACPLSRITPSLARARMVSIHGHRSRVLGFDVVTARMASSCEYPCTHMSTHTATAALRRRPALQCTSRRLERRSCSASNITTRVSALLMS
jgi:hypothetical protein